LGIRDILEARLVVEDKKLSKGPWVGLGFVEGGGCGKVK